MITILLLCRLWAWFLPFAYTDQLGMRRYNDIRKHGNEWGQLFSELDKRENLRLKIITEVYFCSGLEAFVNM